MNRSIIGSHLVHRKPIYSKYLLVYRPWYLNDCRIVVACNHEHVTGLWIEIVVSVTNKFSKNLMVVDCARTNVYKLAKRFYLLERLL